MAIWGLLIDPIAKIIDKVIPDQAARDAAKAQLVMLQQQGEIAKFEADVKLALGQIETNKVEAADPSLFKSGWRPAVGWVCVLGLLYTFLAQPLLSWASGVWQIPTPPPLDMGDLLTLLAGMLGLGGLRTFEKAQKVA